jgi:hypothetical protein
MGLKIVIPIEYQRVKKISLMAMGSGGGEFMVILRVRGMSLSKNYNEH